MRSHSYSKMWISSGLVARCNSQSNYLHVSGTPLHFRCSCWRHVLAQSMVIIHWLPCTYYLFPFPGTLGHLISRFKAVVQKLELCCLAVPPLNVDSYFATSLVISSFDPINVSCHTYFSSFFILFEKIQMPKISARLSPIKMWFVSSKWSLIKDSEKVRWLSCRSGDGKTNKQMNRWIN